MNRIWSLSESTEKGEEEGLISRYTNSDRDLDEHWISKNYTNTEESTITPRHFQQKFTYYTFAKAMENISMSQERGHSPLRPQQGPSPPSISGMSSDNSKSAHYHVRRAHKTPKSRHSRARERRSDEENQDATERSEISHQNTIKTSPLLEISEEVYAVRQAALTVMEPLTYGWLIMMIGGCISAELATAYFLNLIPHFRYWFILLPCWLAHAGIFICHVLSFRALSIFISDANENRQRDDTTDPYDRTEYLPILQKSLKFSLKMGMISCSLLIFEILVYVRIAKESISLSRMLTPLWVVATMGILNGIVCKTQHILSLFIWILLFIFMMLLILRVDYGVTLIETNVIIAPLMFLLTVVTFIWLYILYGHRVGYFRLTQWQLRAGILYSLGTVICLISIILLANWWSYYPFGTGMQVLMCLLTPLIVALIGFGAWSVNRDEFERLLRFGGQAKVHPKKLRFERRGWTAVEGIGVVSVPMLGEIEYEPLKSSVKKDVEICCCCECYAYEDENELNEPLSYSRIAYRNSPNSFTDRLT